MDPTALRGRDAEVAALDHALDRVGSGPGPVVCVVGEPGIGKTRLLGHLREQAHRRGMLVLGGSGAEFERGAPFAAWVEALEEHVAALPADETRSLDADDLRRLEAVLPTLRGERDALGEPPAERHRTLGALRSLLETLSVDRPLVLTLDDLHWVDESSLELVLHLLRRPLRAPVLLAFAFRPRALAEAAGDARAAFVATRADPLLEPGPLSPAEAAALVADRVAPAGLDALLRESGGNPFYLEQLADAVVRSGGPTPAPAGGETAPALPGVPAAVAGSLAAELEQLSAAEQLVCVSAAVVGDPFDAHLAAAAAALAPDAALAAIDGLCRAGLVRATGELRAFGFRHPIVRRAAYEALAPGARLLAHGRIAARMAADDAPALARAPHVAAAARPGDAAAIEVLIAAAEAVTGRSPAIAARWYTAALGLLEDGDPGRRSGLLVALATAQGASGQLHESRATMVELLATLPPELAFLRTRVVSFLALVGHMLGRHGEASAFLRAELASLGDPRAPEAAELGLGVTVDCLYAPDYDSMQRFAADADEAARRSGDPTLVAASAGGLALAAYCVGQIAESLACAERALALTAALTDAQLAVKLDGLLTIAWAAMSLGLQPGGIAIAERALAISLATGQSQHVVPLTVARAVMLVHRGDLGAATTQAEDLLDATRLSGVDQLVAWGLTLRGWIAYEVGDLVLSRACHEEAWALARAQERTTYFVAHAAFHLAEVLLADGEAEASRRLILDVGGGPGLPLAERPLRSRWYEILTRASLAVGDVDGARAWADRAAEAVAGSSLGARVSEAGMARAAVLLAGGDGPGARAAALKAAAAAEAGGARLLAARASVLAARGAEREEAIELLERCLATFAACGADRARDEAVRELRRLGRRIGGGGRRGTGLGGPGALSGREHEVALLVADGLTNREIAARLVLSDKTIETHVSAVLRKLGVPARGAIGTALLKP